MNAKEYLSQIKQLDIKIQQRKEQLDELRLLAMENNSPTLNENKVQTSHGSGRMADVVIKYLEKAREINELVDTYVNVKLLIIDQIQNIEDTRYMDLLYKRYVEYKSFERIAVEVNYSYEWVKELHGEALKAFSEMYQFN